MTLAALQLWLQRELFDPSNEQLLALVECEGTDKKGRKRDVFLSLVNRLQPSQYQISIVELRASGDGGSSASGSAVGPGGRSELPKRKRVWNLRELKAIDAQGDEPSFHLEFDKQGQFIWKALDVDEKKRFLSTLINLNTRHQKSNVSLSNLPKDVIIVDLESVVSSEHAKEGSSGQWPLMNKDSNEAGDGSYEPISSKEASDLMALMEKCEHAVTNADIFMDDLMRELNILDGANIYSIMASEENIDSLMEMLEKASKHTEALESRLNQYDDMLEHIRDSMDKMEGKTVSIETVNLNNKKLLDTLERVLQQLDLPYKYQSVLQEADFSNSKKLRECTLSAKALERVLTADIDPNLVKMTAVQDQQKRCEKLKERFSKSVCRHLTNLFIHIGNDTSNLDAGNGQLKLKRRKNIHKELMKYSELVHWVKSMDPKNFAALQATYRENLCKLYEKDIHQFFEMARYKISGGRALQPVAGSSTDLAGGKKGIRSSNLGLLGTDSDSINSELSLSERERFDDIMETALIELEDVCMDEQFFSSNFFQMEQIDVNNPDQKEAKRVMEQARKMMAEIFPSLENELLQFISFYERSDSFFTLHAMVRLSKHVLSTQNTGSFLAISFGTVLVQVKRNFDKFMQVQSKSIQESRPPKKAKCGILPFISNFDGFLSTTEGIFRSSDRRAELEKWYLILVNDMIAAIVRISREHGKTPAEVIKMENFHHLHSLLAQKKISALDNIRKDIKQKYVDALNAYVTQYFGRPLEKLNVFFEGVQQLVAAGIKESEIGFQIAYSKQELRKIIAVYPGGEVKRGLERLYKKVERHLCEEENLNQVVWRAMQEEFIRQYKNIEDLIQRCYPGAQITLEFTLDEILGYFSEIAISH